MKTAECSALVLLSGFLLLTSTYSYSQAAQDKELRALRKRIQSEFETELPVVPVPSNNPQTGEKAALGQALFFDPNLSSCGNIACASCHVPEQGFGDGQPVSEGCAGATGRRNSNTVYNGAYLSHLFWDGRVQTLEEQALGPIVDPAEMANTWANVLEYLRSGVHPGTGKSFPAAKAYYAKRFEEVFDGVIDSTSVSKAIASYERTAITWNSPYDRWVKGDEDALTDSQKRGLLAFFGRADCVHCHVPPHFTDSDFHNIGTPKAGFETPEQFPHNSQICGGVRVAVDPGRAEVPFLRSSCSDIGRFKTPTLRNVELSGPYMHNGVFQTLDEVVRHYEAISKGFATAIIGELNPELRKARLGDGGGSATDVADITAFLKALTGSQLKSTSTGIAPPSGQ